MFWNKGYRTWPLCQGGAILLKLGSKFGHVINLKNSACSVRIYTGIITALSEGFACNKYASGQLQGAQWDVMACQTSDLSAESLLLYK